MRGMALGRALVAWDGRWRLGKSFSSLRALAATRPASFDLNLPSFKPQPKILTSTPKDTSGHTYSCLLDQTLLAGRPAPPVARLLACSRAIDSDPTIADSEETPTPPPKRMAPMCMSVRRLHRFGASDSPSVPTSLLIMT